MKTLRHSRTGFTLIELLVVIAVIAILASLIFPITGALKKQRIIRVAQAELKQAETAIDAYHSKRGHYPPDNPSDSVINPLYFELLGVSNTGTYFVTKDGGCQISSVPATVAATFGVNGFVNVSRGGNSDEAVKADSYLSQLRPNQIGSLDQVGTEPHPCILVCSVGWDNDDTSKQIVPYTLTHITRLNPFQYNSSHPTNNPASYDLWVDVLIGGKTNRISNWSAKPQIIR